MINNQYVSPSTGQFVDVFNPANEQVIASVYAKMGFEWGAWRSLITGCDVCLLRRPNAGPADVDAAVTAARACFESEAWQAATGKDRYVCASLFFFFPVCVEPKVLCYVDGCHCLHRDRHTVPFGCERLLPRCVKTLNAWCTWKRVRTASHIKKVCVRLAVHVF
jgi:hypothetical protein